MTKILQNTKFSFRTFDRGITPVLLRPYQRRLHHVTSAPLWLWFWALVVYESVDIIGRSCSPYFILFIVFRLSPIGLRLSQFEKSCLGLVYRVFFYLVLLCWVQCLVPHRFGWVLIRSTLIDSIGGEAKIQVATCDHIQNSKFFYLVSSFTSFLVS